MRFDVRVTDNEKENILRAIRSIEKHGDRFQVDTAGFIEETDLTIFVIPSAEAGGSGSVQIANSRAARRAVRKGNISRNGAAEFVRLNLGRENIDEGGQRVIEGTLIHEGKHARDFARMLETFSKRDSVVIFNPTAFQREYSAHITSALYLMRRGGEYADEGVSLGILESVNGKTRVSRAGILKRLKDGYGLSTRDQGGRLSEFTNPPIGSPRRKFLGIF